MKVQGVVLSCVALLNAVLAQQSLIDRLPDCAAQCFEVALPMTTCKPDEINCLCIDIEFQTAAATCNAANCTVIETLSATNTTRAACGIPIKDASDTMIGVTAAFGGLALVMVIMRLIDRGLSAQAKLGWDDLLIGLAGFSSVVQNVPVFVAGRLGFGKDIWAITPSGLTASLKWLYVTYFMYQVAEALCQLSICAFYLRIMTDPYTRKIVWVLIGLVTCFGIGNTFAMIFNCMPITYFWDGWKGEMTGTCIDIRLFGFIRGGVEIALDLAILTLPLPMLYHLQMSTRKKLQIMSMFCVGFVITVVSCLRIHGLIQFGQTQNPTYDNVPGVYWCVTECNLFIVVACMPAMHAILQRALPSIFPRSRNASGYAQGQYGSSGPGKGSYFSQSDRRQKSGSNFPFGVITKSTDVKISREDRSDSDVELVDRPPYK
ncbi:hypothetical protein K458DRAFT_345236 [Lentithecium fluviatile CBS 122367]|uniref:CFEM domain-containing protein n=1 Tax=Lentithecium fluviatile CBS 122367 TaxID=1168545 RepID=A0A6G1IQ84_9PLEO|nr:hypothetical protein K458DRAFT_345236 [Lentithecium fluviatile CBS 122367]